MTQPQQANVSPVWPSYIDDYAFTMSGAHRKPAYEVGAPSLTWHTAFWKPGRTPQEKIDPSFASSLARRSHWIAAIEEFILRVYDALEAHRISHNAHWPAPSLTNLQPSALDPSNALALLRNYYPKLRNGHDRYTAFGELPGTRYETVHIDAVWNSMPLDIRFEVTGEYFTVTSTIDFSRIRHELDRQTNKRRRRRRTGEFDPKNSEYFDVARAFHHVIRDTSARFEGPSWFSPLNPKRRTKDDISDGLKEHTRLLYLKVWDDLKQDIFYAKPGDNGYIVKLGGCFMDVRNLALQCTFDGKRLFNPWKLADEGEPTEVQPPEASLLDSITGHRFKNDDIDWVDAIHPILLSVESDLVNTQDGAPIASDPVEYSFTKFCDQRCIYGSGFGPLTQPQDRYEPLTYILLFGFDDHREIGRHLLREHTVGTLRLAALHGLQRTKQDYDHRLNDLEDIVVNLQQLVSDAFATTYRDEENGRSKKLEDLDNQIEAKLVDVHESLDKLDFEGLITFRAARSRYYLERFKALSVAMKGSDIKGYQPFDIFIEHRLARAYSILQRVADRYNHIRDQEVKLRREWMSLKSENHQRLIEGFQETAEILFYLVLFPYYGTHIAVSLINLMMSGSRWVVSHFPGSLTFTEAVQSFSIMIHLIIRGERHTYQPDENIIRAILFGLGVRFAWKALKEIFRARKRWLNSVAQRTRRRFKRSKPAATPVSNNAADHEAQHGD